MATMGKCVSDTVVVGASIDVKHRGPKKCCSRCQCVCILGEQLAGVSWTSNVIQERTNWAWLNRGLSPVFTFRS